VRVDVALSNAMGLGGHNGCVLLGRAAEDATIKPMDLRELIDTYNDA